MDRDLFVVNQLITWYWPKNHPIFMEFRFFWSPWSSCWLFIQSGGSIKKKMNNAQDDQMVFTPMRNAQFTKSVIETS